MSHIRIGDDSTEYSTTNMIVRDNIFDGGFLSLNPIIAGRYLTIRRDDDDGDEDGKFYNFHELRAYQTPNLMKIYAQVI